MSAPTDEEWGIDPADWLPYVEKPEPRVPGALLDCPAIAEPLPELEYLVRAIGLVAGGGAPHLVAGYGFSGKTMAMQSMLLSLATGTPVWGIHGTKRRRVAHVDLEQGERLTRSRYQRLAKAMGADLAAMGDSLVLSVMPPWRLRAADRSLWRGVMAERDVVLVDSLKAATNGQDENSSDIRSGLDMLGSLSEETGCRAIVIHHARKPVEGAEGGVYSIRGSGAILDASDGVYVLSGAKGEPIKCEHVKARSHGECMEDFSLTVTDTWNDQGVKDGLRVLAGDPTVVEELRAAKRELAAAEMLESSAERIRQVLRQCPGLGVKDLRERCGMSGGRFANALAHLGKEVSVVSDSSGHRPTLRHYLVDKVDKVDS